MATDSTLKIGGQTTSNGAPTASIIPAAPTVAVPIATPTVKAVAPAASPAPVASANQSNTTLSGLVINADGTTNFEASLAAIKDNIAKLNTGATNLSDQNSTDVSGSSGSSSSKVVSSSSPVVQQESKITQDVSDLNATNDASTKAHNDYLAGLDAQTAALEARRAAEVNGINADFDTTKAQTVDTQAKETGAFTSTLARIGGFLGDSASASGALVNLNQKHTFQLNDLETKRQSAIQDAKNAIDDKQFAIANLKATEAKDYAKQIADNKQQFFDNSLRILTAQQNQDEAQRAAVKDKLTNLAYVDPATVTPETKSQIDEFYGTPGFTDQYLAVTSQANQVKSQKDLMDARKSTLDFLQNIPAGQKVTFPDGTEYTGMGKAGDVATFLQVDSSGTGHLITYNKLTGDKNITSVGVVGKASGDGSGGVSLAKTPPVVIDNATSIFQTKLEQTKKGSDYDPDVYIELRNQLKESKNPQLVPLMDKLFLDKNNQFFSDDAINKLRSKGVYVGDISLPAAPAVDDTGDDISEGQ